MAKQTGKVQITGKIGNIIYYKMNGKYYAREKSSLSGKRVKRDPAFRRTMEFAKLFGLASKIASEVYRKLPAGVRNYKLYRKMTGIANKWLKDGVDQLLAAEKLQSMFVSKDLQSTVTGLRKPIPKQVEKKQVKYGTVVTSSLTGKPGEIISRPLRELQRPAWEISSSLNLSFLHYCRQHAQYKNEWPVHKVGVKLSAEVLYKSRQKNSFAGLDASPVVYT